MSTSIAKFSKLKEFVSGKTVIIEGYNFVGKSFLIKKLSNEHKIIDKGMAGILPEAIRWSFIITLLSMMRYCDLRYRKFIISQSVLAGSYYNLCRPSEIGNLITLDTMYFFRDAVKEMEVPIILIELNKTKFKELTQDLVFDKKLLYDGYLKYMTHVKDMIKFLGLEDLLVFYKNTEILE